MKKNIIITIHGVNKARFHNWQDEFYNKTKKEDPDIKVFKFTYGFFFAPFAWLTLVTKFLRVPSLFRRIVIGKFVKFIKRIQKRYPHHQINIIAHSFGTWVTYNAINREPDFELGNIVFVQGVISSHIEKTNIINWLEYGRIKSVHSWSSPNDTVVKLAPPPFGKQGYRGFVRYKNKKIKYPLYLNHILQKSTTITGNGITQNY